MPARKVPVYLAIHTFGNGMKHIRRWCPDDPGLFLGFQRQTDDAKHWLAACGNPEWRDVETWLATREFPECADGPDLSCDPFEVMELR